MRRGLMVGLVLGVVGVLAGQAAAEFQEDRLICPGELVAAMEKNQRLAAYVQRNGMPNLAASQFLSDHRPWDERQVTLYYLDRRKEVSFARAWILGSPEIDVERYERDLSDADVAALEPVATGLSCPTAPERITVFGFRTGRKAGMGPADRAEAAAARAESAARRVEAAAVVVEEAAVRTEAVLEKLEQLHR